MLSTILSKMPRIIAVRNLLLIPIILTLTILARIYLTPNELTPETIEVVDQKDDRLIQYVRMNHIMKANNKPYSQTVKDVKKTQDAEVDDFVYPLFKGKRHGFYIEVGAYDGIYSHTLLLEKDFEWTGILIECNPQILPVLLSSNRKSYFANVCLSTSFHPAKLRMTSMDSWLASSSIGVGDLYPSWIKSNFTTFEVMTIPLFTIISAVGQMEIDLIVLDVQSIEVDVLNHFPFDLVKVKVWVIEIYFYSMEERAKLVEFMISKGYNEVKKLTNDYVFYNN